MDAVVSVGVYGVVFKVDLCACISVDSGFGVVADFVVFYVGEGGLVEADAVVVFCNCVVGEDEV